MATLRVGNTTVGKISVLEPYEGIFDAPPEFTYKPDVKPWVRNPDWIDMPTINTGDEKAAMLIAVPSGGGITVGLMTYGTYESSTARPTYTTVDWGDGSDTDLIYGNDTRTYAADLGRIYVPAAIHTYNYEDLPSSTDFDYNGVPARQAIIQMDGSVSGLHHLDIRYMNIDVTWTSYSGIQLPNTYANNGQSSTLLDLHVQSSTLDSFSTIDTARVFHSNLERIVLNISGALPHMSRTFQNMESLQSLSFPSTISSGVKDFYYTFGQCRKLSYIPPLDATAATGMMGTFSYCNSLLEVPSGFDNTTTSNCTNFYDCFTECYSLNGIPELDYSNADRVDAAFSRMYQIKTIPSGLDFSSATNINSMFSNCLSLESIPTRFFDQFTNVTTARGTFSYCTNLRNFGGPINLPQCTDMRDFSVYCTSLEELHLGNLTSMKNNTNPVGNGFYNAFNGLQSNRKITIDYPEDCYAADMRSMFAGNSKIDHIPYINTSGAVLLDTMFSSCLSATTAPVFDFSSATSYGSFYNGCRSLSKVGGFITSSTPDGTTGSATRLFRDCLNLREFPSGLYKPGTSNPYLVNEQFYQTRITELPDLYISGVTHPSYGAAFQSMFYLRKVGNIEFASGCVLRNFMISAYRLQQLPDWDVSNVEDFTGAFSSCRSLRWSDIRNTSCNISYYDCYLSSGALTHIFNNLASGVTSKTIDVRHNYGTPDLHTDSIAIATSKGWTVLT